MQMLVLAHLYAKTDSASLATLRSVLLRKRYTPAEISVGVGLGVTATAGAPQHCGTATHISIPHAWLCRTFAAQ